MDSAIDHLPLEIRGIDLELLDHLPVDIQGWMHRLGYPDIWEKIRDIPDHIFWSVRQDVKARMFHMVRHRVAQQHARNYGSESHLGRLLRFANPAKPDVLTIGFGRRFATYKRATLLLNNLDTLRRILGDKERPVLFVFSGKAHPADEPGQELIRSLSHIARQEEFEGKILFIEGALRTPRADKAVSAVAMQAS